MFSSMLVTGYTMSALPFIDSIQTRQEILNDMLVWLNSYILCAYTPILATDEDRNFYGWFNIGFVAAIVLINLSFMVFMTGHEARRKCLR